MLNEKVLIIHLIVDNWIFSRTKIFTRKSGSWDRFVSSRSKSRFKKCKICLKDWFSKLNSNENKLDIGKLKNVPIVRALTFQTSLEVAISSYCFSGNDTKKWFLTNWGRDGKTQGVHERRKFGENFNVCWVRLWTTNKYFFMEC